MSNKNTNSILHSPFCFQQRDVHLNQKGFGLIGALIGGVISLIVIGTVNNLVLRSIKKSSETEKIMRILNDKQRIIGLLKNNLVCARTLENYPMTEQEKTAGKTLYDSTTTKLEIKKSPTGVLESFDPGDLSSIEKIVMKQTSDENNFALFFHEKSLDSENPLYERKPQEATQPIVTCGTTTAGKYVINKCGPACSLCPAGQERFNETCIPKCNEGYVRQNGVCTCPQGLVEVENQCQCSGEGEEFFEGLCVPICTGELTRQDDGECGCAEGLKEMEGQCTCPEGKQLSTEEPYEGLCLPVCTGGRVLNDTTCKCPENQLAEKDEHGDYQCTCPGKLILNETTGECERGKPCQLPDGTTLLHTRLSDPSYHSSCSNEDGTKRYWCVTKQGYDNGLQGTWLSPWERTPGYYCYNGETRIVPRDPYKMGGECTLEYMIDLSRTTRRYDEGKWEINPGDIIAIPASSRYDSTICYVPPSDQNE